MKYIVLTQGKKTTVDNEDYFKLSQFKWYYDHGYARRDEKGKKIYMHRVITKAPKGKSCDHKNHDKLDNRKENLRICTQSQNLGNQNLNAKNTSGYKGVSWNKHLKYWTSSVKLNQKTKVKYFKDKIEAAKDYNERAKEAFGEFALLNKI